MVVDLEVRVHRTCSRALDAKQLRIALVRDLASVLGFDAHVWLLTDPTTCVGTSPLATVPGLPWPRLPDLVRARYLTVVNRWTTLRDMRRHVDTLHAATRGDLSTSLLWHEIMSDLGGTDVASVDFCDRHGCWAWLDLWRIGGKAFTGDDVASLLAARPAITTALRIRQAANFAGHHGDRAMGPAVVVLDPTLPIRGQTAQAAGNLHRLNPPDPAPDGTPAPAIPAAAADNVAAQLVAREAVSRVFLDERGWITLEADRIAGEDPPQGRDIVVTIEPTSVPDRHEMFSRGAPPHRARARDPRAPAARQRHPRDATELTVSEHTVNDHAKAILAKTGCATRQALLARVMG